MENNQIATTTSDPDGLGSLTSLSETIAKNRPVILERVTRALAVASKIKEITSSELDQYANDYVVKVNKALKELEALRKEYTGPINKWLDAQIAPENELKAEVERIKKLRNAYAAEKLREKQQEEQRIKKEAAYIAYEGQIKAAMKVSVENGIAQKVIDFEKAIADAFDAATLETIEQLTQRLNIKPALKPEFFENLLKVPYDLNMMSAAQFDELRERARGYWKFDKINEAFVKSALEIVDKWREKIPARRQELELIAKGGEQAELLKKKAEERAEYERKEAERIEAERKKALEQEAAVEAQTAELDAQFKAQVQMQQVEEAKNVQSKKVYLLDAAIEGDAVKVAKVMMSVMLNVLTEPNEKLGGKLPIRKKSGEYVEGIQYFLDELAKIKRTVEIEGLIQTEEVKAINRSK